MTLPDKCPFCAAAVAIMSDGKPCRSAEGLWVAFECLTSLHAGHDERTSQSRPCEAAERTRLSTEVDTLRTANAALVERVKRLEAVGDKMAAHIYRDARLWGLESSEFGDEWRAAKGQP